jgi:hypothetical protein
MCGDLLNCPASATPTSAPLRPRELFGPQRDPPMDFIKLEALAQHRQAGHVVIFTL